MADFICLAMASQYADTNTDTVSQPSNSNTNSFRRSLGTSALFGRRSSRSNVTTSSTITTRPTSDSSIINHSDEHQSSIHIRIVPSIENPSRSLVFSIIERDLEVGRVIKIGRFTDRSSIQNHISFKSKVVSRSHCEIWLNNEGKVQLKDTRSSSGTFVNHVRLSPANTESRPVEIRDGDLVQLGVDYQGGFEEIYRSVKMRFEVNRPEQQRRPASYSMAAFNNIRNLTSVLPSQTTTDQQQVITTSPSSSSPLCHNNENNQNNNIEVEECCICLYALAPFQALFVAPCSHSYHFKCIRPLFDSYPGFQCPICRTYSDLDASVAIEAEEVIEKFGLRKSSIVPAHKELEPTETKDSYHQQEQDNGELVSSSSSVQPTNVILLSSIIPPAPELPLSTTLVACTTSLSGIISSPTSSSHHGLVDRNNNEPVSRGFSNNNAGDHRATIIFEDDNVIMGGNHHSQHVINNAASSRNSNNLVEKIKMAFSNEKRKSSKRRTHSNSDTSSDEDLPETFFDLPCSSSPPSSPRNQLQPILSRQSTQHNNSLAEIVEESSNSGH
ncbi:uncharacterized protein EV154DRAFT_513847 [Mucor mucedo]|uniref:uncharacterized protein n=1 Tax=Mucor mucedo TaxID=29922 RepID=UPI00221EE201|nr:uncharacterized protein EV154DRAFT_513847 [Mucor mucedo]KAI7889718.1 hypothetical protein EV154DRAFT_513847 [Mucor mucedo]